MSNKFEDNTFGIGKDGWRGPDNQSPALDDFTPSTEAGNGFKLVKFRGRYMHPFYAETIKRTEQAKRKHQRSREQTRFIDRHFNTSLS